MYIVIHRTLVNGICWHILERRLLKQTLKHLTCVRRLVEQRATSRWPVACGKHSAIRHTVVTVILKSKIFLTLVRR